MATEWTFERAMTRLEQIVAALESGKCSLDDSMKLFEEGTKLTSYCSRQLTAAEQKIRQLTETAAAPEAPAAPETAETGNEAAADDGETEV